MSDEKTRYVRDRQLWAANKKRLEDEVHRLGLAEKTWRGRAEAHAAERDDLRCELALTRAALANAEAQRDAKRLFVCEGCAFTFDAQHTNGDGSLSCPVCEIAAIEAQRDAACAEAASLRAVLSGKHDGRCADAKQGNGSGPCDCGSDAALAAPSTAEQALRDRDERVRADERAAMWGDRENIERVLAGQPVAHVFSAGGMAEHDAKVRAESVEQLIRIVEMSAERPDAWDWPKLPAILRGLTQVHPSGQDAMPSEWEHSSCGTCGLDDVPCAIDGIVWTCRECWPTGTAAR